MSRRLEPFDYNLEALRERFVECTDGGGDEHFAALHLIGQCPYCGMDEDEAETSSEGM